MLKEEEDQEGENERKDCPDLFAWWQSTCCLTVASLAACQQLILSLVYLYLIRSFFSCLPASMYYIVACAMQLLLLFARLHTSIWNPGLHCSCAPVHRAPSSCSSCHLPSFLPFFHFILFYSFYSSDIFRCLVIYLLFSFTGNRISRFAFCWSTLTDYGNSYRQIWKVHPDKDCFTACRQSEIPEEFVMERKQYSFTLNIQCYARVFAFNFQSKLLSPSTSKFFNFSMIFAVIYRIFCRLGENFIHTSLLIRELCHQLVFLW